MDEPEKPKRPRGRPPRRKGPTRPRCARLDAQEDEDLRRLAVAWGVRESDAIRRAISEAARGLPPRPEDEPEPEGG